MSAIRHSFAIRFIVGILSLLCLSWAAWLATYPRPVPKPDLPPITAPAANETLLIWLWPPPSAYSLQPETLGIIQRAQTVGAHVVVYSGKNLADAIEAENPTRIYQPAQTPNIPLGYHPDQWPTIPDEWRNRPETVLLELTPEEQRVKNTAVLNALRLMQQTARDSGAKRDGDIPPEEQQNQLQLLSLARRAEIYLEWTP